MPTKTTTVHIEDEQTSLQKATPYIIIAVIIIACILSCVFIPGFGHGLSEVLSSPLLLFSMLR